MDENIVKIKKQNYESLSSDLSDIVTMAKRISAVCDEHNFVNKELTANLMDIVESVFKARFKMRNIME